MIYNMLTTQKINWPQMPTLTDAHKLNWLQSTFIFGGSAFLIWKITNIFIARRKYDKIKKLIEKRRKERDDIIEKLKSHLNTTDENVSEKRTWIVNLSTIDLVEKLHREELSPIEVLEAFQWSTLAAHEKTNCVTQFITEAAEWCTQLESKYSGTGTNKPPLYGIPFSVKESNGVKGYDATAGISRYLFFPLQEEGALVVRLRQLGAIPFVLTNVPQTLLAFGCSNPIYGSTTNPRNVQLSPGGSSGGEGALLALKGAVFGMGSDLAGSIRIPAHFCGIASLKPCSLRLSQTGGRKHSIGRTSIPASFGPMARDVGTLVVFMENILGDEFFAMDTYTVPLPFRRHLYDNDKKLTIGYYDNDGFVEPVPAIRRAVLIAKESLEQRGHRLVKFNFPADMVHIFSLICRALQMDAGYHFVNDVLKDEIIDITLTGSPYLMTKPIFIRRTIAALVKFFGASKLGMVLDGFETRTRDFSAALASIYEFKNKFNIEWRRLGLDAMICPPAAGNAVPHDFVYSDATRMFPAFAYTVMYNLLDYPAGIVPVTQVNEEDANETNLKYPENDFYAKLVKQCNGKNTIGQPVGVQCVALTYNEEVCLKVMKEIEDSVKHMKK